GWSVDFDVGGFWAGFCARPLFSSAVVEGRRGWGAAARRGRGHRRSACDALPAPPVGLRRPPTRDIEVVVESALSLVVVVSALWNWRFRCWFPPLRFGVFRHWRFVFCGTSRRAAVASAWASSTVLMRCHSCV